MGKEFFRRGVIYYFLLSAKLANADVVYDEIQSLGLLSDSDSYANAVSNDGLTIVVFSGGTFSRAKFVSADGNVVAGY